VRGRKSLYLILSLHSRCIGPHFCTDCTERENSDNATLGLQLL